MKKKIKNIILIYEDGSVDIKSDFEQKDGGVTLRGNGGGKQPPPPPTGGGG